MKSEEKFIEEKIGKRLDRCVSDTLVKGCGGLFIGSAVSVLFFRRRLWPAWLGAGFGIGVAYRTCEKDINVLK